ncbi:unnamed protein product [Diamesa serratosioi]
MINLLITSLIIIGYSRAETTQYNCCNTKSNQLINRTCDNNGSGIVEINLKCSDKYVLDSRIEDDSFNVAKNGSLFLTELDIYMNSDNFCLVNIYDNEAEEFYPAALVCFTEPEIEIDFFFMMKAVLLFISVAFLVLTLYVYYLLSELRETQDKATIYTLVCLTLFLILLGILQIHTPLYFAFFDGCTVLAFLVYFWTLAYFSWLNCVLANVWKTVVLRKWKIAERNWYFANHVYAWTMPTVMTIILLFHHSDDPVVGITSCWFHRERDQILLVYTPISVMISINVVLCVWTSFILVRSGGDITPDRRKSLKYKWMLYFKLFLLGGCTWIFEVLSYTFRHHQPSKWLWTIVDCVNCLHGVLIFLVLIVFRKRIKKELANKKVLWFKVPNEWADTQDDEQQCLENDVK